MSLDEKISLASKKINEAVRPLVFFDDDCDGVCSFLQIYKLNSEARGVCVKGKPVLEAKYLRKIDEHSPDLVVILDKAMVEDEFLSKCSVNIIWVDHHQVQTPRKALYINSLEHGFDYPTSYLCYLISNKKSVWLGCLGCVGDWNLCLKDEFNKTYSDLLGSVSAPDEALFNTKLGLLAKIISFNLKNKTSDVMKSVKVLTRIESPYEILESLTPKGKFIYKKYASLNQEFEELKRSVNVTDEKVLVFIYDYSRNSFSADLSNELLFENKDKIIVVARRKENEYVLSLRSSGFNIEKPLKLAINGLNGFGGGHEYACGAVIQKDDFDVFLSRFKELVL